MQQPPRGKAPSPPPALAARGAVLSVKPLPNDEKAKAAEAVALKEIEKLNKLLVEHGVGVVNPIEKAILITYIKASELGMLEDA